MTRKISPQEHCFGSVAGHDVAKSYLEHALEGDLLPHALLFHGPAGVGKLSMAYAVIKYINCRENSPPDCKCDMCRKISENKFADVLLVEPRGATGQITLTGWRPGKDDPDNLQYYRFVETRPLEGSRKVLIMRHAERMNVALANYILKLMEEPPPYLSLVLISNRKNDLLPTIRSRCAGVKFSPLSIDEMRGYATARGFNAEADDVDAAIRQSEGRPGLFADRMGATDEADQQDLATAMLSFRQYGFVSLFRVASDLLELGEAAGTDVGSRFELTLQQMTNWFRDALLVKMNADGDGHLLTFPRLRGQLAEFGADMAHERLLAAADAVGRDRNLAGRQLDKDYARECLLMEIGRIVRG
jgi:DNA polymerase-3 subunit delta'